MEGAPITNAYSSEKTKEKEHTNLTHSLFSLSLHSLDFISNGRIKKDHTALFFASLFVYVCRRFVPFITISAVPIRTIVISFDRKKKRTIKPVDTVQLKKYEVEFSSTVKKKHHFNYMITVVIMINSRFIVGVYRKEKSRLWMFNTSTRSSSITGACSCIRGLISMFSN